MIYFVPTTKYQIKFLAHNIIITKTLKINIEVTGSCEGPLGHQAEQPPKKCKIKVSIFSMSAGDPLTGR